MRKGEGDKESTQREVLIRPFQTYVVHYTKNAQIPSIKTIISHMWE